MKKLICLLLMLGCGPANAELVRMELSGICSQPSCANAGLTEDSPVTGFNAPVTGFMLFDRDLLPTFDEVSRTTLQGSDLIDFQYTFGDYSFDIDDVISDANVVVDISPGGIPILYLAGGVSSVSPNSLAINSDGAEIGFDGIQWATRIRLGIPGCCDVNANTGAMLGTVVPIPAAAWLFGSGLGLLGWIRQRRVR